MREYTGLRWHRLFLALVDAALVNLALVASWWLHFNGAFPADWWPALRLFTFGSTPLLLLSGLTFGLYNRIWEYARAEAVVAIFLAVTIPFVITTPLFFFWMPGHFSFSVWGLAWLLAFFLVGGVRFAWQQIRRRLWANHRKQAGLGEPARIFIYGAGHTGWTLARHIDTHPQSPYRILGFIDDNRALTGMIVGGYRVLGTGADLPALVRQYPVDKVVIAAPSVSGDRLRQMLEYIRSADVEARTLPRFLESLDKPPTPHAIREIRYEDLLERDLADIEMQLEPDYIQGCTILVTGAGGSIGAELCRQICRYKPREIILLGRGENRIHDIYSELQGRYPEIIFTPCICNFTNENDVEQVFARHRPHVVFHAGAHKHVYLMEGHPVEALRNNVLGTGYLALAAMRYGVERFIAISTDKAVEPCNVMGASKRLCELLLLGLQAQAETKFTLVRFGNVIGSSGSVLTIFKRQLAAGQPLTVTHPEATRFFMTVQEAAFLVLHAGALSEGGEIFVLEMGPPVRIYDMAREFLRLHGRDPDAPGAIKITGLRPGERLHERLYSAWERLEPTRCPLIKRVVSRGPLELDLSPRELMARARQALASEKQARALLATVCEPAPTLLRDLGLREE